MVCIFSNFLQYKIKKTNKKLLQSVIAKPFAVALTNRSCKTGFLITYSYCHSTYVSSKSSYSGVSNKRVNTDHVHLQNPNSTRAYWIPTRPVSSEARSAEAANFF